MTGYKNKPEQQVSASVMQQFFCLLVYTLNSLAFFFGLLIVLFLPSSGAIVLSVSVPLLLVVYRREMERPEGRMRLAAYISNSIFMFLICIVLLSGRIEAHFTFIFLFLALNLVYLSDRYQSHSDCGKSVFPALAVLLLIAYFLGLYDYTANTFALAGLWFTFAGGAGLWLTRGVTTKSGKTLRNYALVIIGFSLAGAWLLAPMYREAQTERAQDLPRYRSIALAPEKITDMPEKPAP